MNKSTNKKAIKRGCHPITGSFDITPETTEIHPTERMWRTLVRVRNVCRNAVVLYIPGRGYGETAVCPKAAIPPVIFNSMKDGARYHVECNIGAKDWNDLCFDRWEPE